MHELEKWLAVLDWAGIYEVSSLGNVRRIKEGKGTRGPNHILTPGAEKGGYLHVKLRFYGRYKLAKIHQLVAAAFIGPKPDKHEINHIDGNTANNKLSNLEYCTSSENKHHAYALGRPLVSCKGVENGRAKLNDEKVIEIRRRYESEAISQQKLADEFGINQTVVSLVVRRVLWPHVAS